MLIFSSYCIYLTCYIQLYQFQKQWGEEKALLYSKLFSTFEKNLIFSGEKKKKANEKPWRFELFWNSPCCSRNVAQELLKLLWKPVKTWCRCLGLKRIQSSWLVQEIIVSTCIQLDLGEFELMWSQRSGREWNMVKRMALMEQDLLYSCLYNSADQCQQKPLTVSFSISYLLHGQTQSIETFLILSALLVHCRSQMWEPHVKQLRKAR